ncbi:MAG: hypothetical protein KC931_14980 [Candidatus Omnitrophica bacterium]|nr:hypothetical protein [Candidatus Omnitrophota bacterium]
MFRITRMAIGLGLCLSLSGEGLARTAEDLFFFSVHWTRTDVIVGSTIHDFDPPDLLCVLAGECQILSDAGEMRSLLLFDDTRISSLESDPNTRSATAEFDLGTDSYQSASLAVDLDSTCFPFEERTDPPEGEIWPADCDAFDRLFTFVIDGDGEEVGYEVARAVTPFGGPMHFEVDLTRLANALSGVHSITVFIATQSDSLGQVTGSAGGWNVTARLDLITGSPTKKVLAAAPLWNGIFRSDTPPPEISFTAPMGADEAFIEYRVTGHGAGIGTTGDCIGPADEFCMRKHLLFVDGGMIDEIVPYNPDGGSCTLTEYEGFSYCLENPTGLPASVIAPRANWAPGEVTPPIVLTARELLVPGDHTFSFEIENVAAGGFWRVSAIYYALGQ